MAGVMPAISVWFGYDSASGRMILPTMKGEPMFQVMLVNTAPLVDVRTVALTDDPIQAELAIALAARTVYEHELADSLYLVVEQHMPDGEIRSEEIRF